jgi:hypothetical protein
VYWAGGDAAEQRPGVGLCSSAARPLRTAGGGAGLLGSFGRWGTCADRRRTARLLQTASRGRGSAQPDENQRDVQTSWQPLPPSFHGGKLKYLVGESWQPSDGVSTLDIGPHGTL